MRSYYLETLGSLEGLAQRDELQRPILPHEVRVQMRAASLNYRDLLIALDQVPGGGTKEHVVPLSDGAGEIVEIGASICNVAIGDRVVANFNLDWIDGPLMPRYLGRALGGSVDGTLSETVILEGTGVVHLPDHLSFEEGAAYGCASITAWSSLVGGKPITAGQTVLVQGTGGVSLFALQFAKAAGAHVIATTSSSEKAQRLRALGADEVVNYVSNPAWQDEIRALTGGLGVDRVVETGGPDTLNKSLQCTRIGGHIAIVGFSGGSEGGFNPLSLLGRGITLEGIAVGSRRHLVDSLRASATKDLRPVIDQMFPFEKAKEAYAHMLARKHVGKVVIVIE